MAHLAIFMTGFALRGRLPGAARQWRKRSGGVRGFVCRPVVGPARPLPMSARGHESKKVGRSSRNALSPDAIADRGPTRHPITSIRHTGGTGVAYENGTCPARRRRRGPPLARALRAAPVPTSSSRRERHWRSCRLQPAAGTQALLVGPAETPATGTLWVTVRRK
jgi:hypothetical protein